MQEVKRGRDTKKHTDMKFVVSASVLLRHLTDVSKIMSAKVNMSMLNYAALTVRDQMLTLRYTDTMLTISLGGDRRRGRGVRAAAPADGIGERDAECAAPF